MRIDCKYKDTCTGCQHIGVPLEEQHNTKKERLVHLLQRFGIGLRVPVQVISPGASGLRDRADLVVDHGRLGLYRKVIADEGALAKSGGLREVLDIDECVQFSPALQNWLSDVRKLTWPVQKGSLRLRVGPDGRRGIWLDFANVDIKRILDEKHWLQSLQKLAFVEIGQRHKVPVLVHHEDDEIFKLKDPQPQVWFQTWVAGRSVDLYSTVAGFTQPSLVANRHIAAIIGGWLDKAGAKNILEFGSGIGNLSFPALAQDRHLIACEIDELSLLGFRKSLQELAHHAEFADIGDRVTILRGDFQRKHPQEFGRFDTVLVNPPRSGLKEFLAPLLSAGEQRPAHFLYMSCYPESFAEDAVKLQAAGYAISDLRILDQFPQTDHYEVLSLWERS